MNREQESPKMPTQLLQRKQRGHTRRSVSSQFAACLHD